MGFTNPYNTGLERRKHHEIEWFFSTTVDHIRHNTIEVNESPRAKATKSLVASLRLLFGSQFPSMENLITKAKDAGAGLNPYSSSLIPVFQNLAAESWDGAWFRSWRGQVAQSGLWSLKLDNSPADGD
jgi:hypothetical protein